MYVYNCNETSCAKSWRPVSHAVKFIPGVPLNFDPCFVISLTPIQRDIWDIYLLLFSHFSDTGNRTAVTNCRIPPHLQFGHFSPQSSGYKSGATITATCDTGYEFLSKDKSNLTCSAGHWQGSFPACVKKGLNYLMFSYF